MKAVNHHRNVCCNKIKMLEIFSRSGNIGEERKFKFYVKFPLSELGMRKFGFNWQRGEGVIDKDKVYLLY